MLPPYELKNKKKFPVAIRGYAQSEVDEHIEFLIERYTELYRKNDELEKQIRLLTSKLDEYETREDAINRAIVGAQKMKERIVSEANEEAELVRKAAKESAERIIGNFKKRVRFEQATLHALMDQVSDFKAQMLEAYEKHMELLNEIAPENADPDYEHNDDAYASRVVEDIRRVANEFVMDSKGDEDAPMADTFGGTDAGEFAPVDVAEEKNKVDNGESVVKAVKTPKKPLRARRNLAFGENTEPTKEEKLREELPPDAEENLKELFNTTK